jgi:hypothetical protein
MREFLATARARSNMLAAGAEAFGNRLGALYLRGIDNGHAESLRLAKAQSARDAARTYKLPILQANKAAHAVVMNLCDQRCPQCKGQRYELTAFGAAKACSICNASGFMMLGKDHWTELHYQVLNAALAAIGAHLKACRAQLERT